MMYLAGGLIAGAFLTMAFLIIVLIRQNNHQAKQIIALGSTQPIYIPQPGQPPPTVTQDQMDAWADRAYEQASSVQDVEGRDG